MKIIECPRDAWQGFHSFIPTDKKAAYLNQLLKVGFDTIDFGSFVSPKAMPQVSDTSQILGKLDFSGSTTSLLAIVANERGAAEACSFDQIRFLGYPFSISETFQLRNTNATIRESLDRVKRISELCLKSEKELVIYISMGFGNPYGDPWNSEIVVEWVEKLSGLGVRIVSLSDTIGVANSEDITSLFTTIIPRHPHLEFGAHFHSNPLNWKPKIEAAYQAGCRRFDGAILGYGGCPMAQDELVGNMATERLIEFGIERNECLTIDKESFAIARSMFMDLINT
ncbi:hydroxymethylglutaryl-CoA lyase [Dyadobacter sp. CY323]|uniref:hydroxymethylglutaryl-CoA lyase n=1 Tax=Dyadobacter sp. CY323 TaxID=2907302 RepID=UPI001F207642|nr:hydroxymethylglutaryl-CoA lyase [Dyadobacter sp. CY323]MCE6988368.1 hydroxymethylglutaryl-CoA lyase [Dyadobacter sp. CY323]